MQAVWGSSRPNRCWEIVMTVMVPGHLVDPGQAIPYRRLTSLVRMIQRRPEICGMIQQVRQTQRVTDLLRPRNRCGPVRLALEALHGLGWIWEVGGLL